MDRPVEELTVAQVKNMTVVQLRGQLSARRLSTSGVKKDLVKRLLDAIGLSEPNEEKPIQLHMAGDGWPGTVPNVSMRAMGSDVVASYLAQQQAALQSAKKAADAARAASSAEEMSDLEPALAMSQAVRSKRGRHGGGKRQRTSTESASSTRVLRSQKRHETTDENVQIDDKEALVEPLMVDDEHGESIVKSKVDNTEVDAESPHMLPAVIVHEAQSTMGPFSMKEHLTAESPKHGVEVEYSSPVAGQPALQDEKRCKGVDEVDAPVQKCSDIFNVDELLKTTNQPQSNILGARSQGSSAQSSGSGNKLRPNYSLDIGDAWNADMDLTKESTQIWDSDSVTSVSVDSPSPMAEQPCPIVHVHQGENVLPPSATTEEPNARSRDNESPCSNANSDSTFDLLSPEATRRMSVEIALELSDSSSSDDSSTSAYLETHMEEMQRSMGVDFPTFPQSFEGTPSLEEPDESSQEIFDLETLSKNGNGVEERDDRSARKRFLSAEEQAPEPKRKWKSSHDLQPSTIISTKVIENLVKSANQELEALGNSRSLGKAFERADKKIEEYEPSEEQKSGSVPAPVPFESFEQNQEHYTRGAIQKTSEVGLKANSQTACSKSSALSFDLQWDVLSTLNPELAEAIILRGPVSPPQKQPTKVVRITGLSRPFAVRNLCDTMALFGSFPHSHFWINNIRSVCLVQYDSAESATKAREALHNVRWPKTNQHCLQVDFGYEGEVEHLKGSEKSEPSHSLSEKSRSRRSGRGHEEVGSQEHAGVDADSEYFGDLSPKNDSVPNLDCLFKKTKKKPHIYYLPLTCQEAIQREEERERRRQERMLYLAKNKEGEGSGRSRSKGSSRRAPSSWNRRYRARRHRSSSTESDDSSSSSKSDRSSSSRDSRRRYRRRQGNMAYPIAGVAVLFEGSVLAHPPQAIITADDETCPTSVVQSGFGIPWRGSVTMAGVSRTVKRTVLPDFILVAALGLSSWTIIVLNKQFSTRDISMLFRFVGKLYVL
uniref:SAP domain-containing protein n=1 Tax=Trichuris muris TaxID=70415 RepID=A0A5S6Q846_TRIMR